MCLPRRFRVIASLEEQLTGPRTLSPPRGETANYKRCVTNILSYHEGTENVKRPIARPLEFRRRIDEFAHSVDSL